MYIFTYTIELPVSPSIGLMVLKQVLEFIDMFTVVVFSAEIVLKWIDNFKSFWRNGWNVFDLIVTILVSMCVCVCVYICVCMYVCAMYETVCNYVMYVCECVCVHVYVCMYVCMYGCTCVYNFKCSTI